MVLTDTHRLARRSTRAPTEWVFVFGAGLLVTFSATQAEEATCSTCHPPQHSEHGGSVHAQLECMECHGGHEEYELDAETIAALTDPDLDAAQDPAFDHGDEFGGKAPRADVPNLCGNCHADVERMNPYGLRTDQLARYWTSNHGKALKNDGELRVAVCTDCHGVHDVRTGSDPQATTYPLNIPGMCANCHADEALMSEFDLPVEIHDEYKRSVHGHLLLEQGDTGAPTCATCHGNHSAMPPGFATVGAVCGQCHQAAAKHFQSSIHAQLDYHKGCVQCHGGGEGRHFHLIERITNPSGVMIERYEHLLQSEPSPSPEQVTEAIHSEPKEIINRAIATCTDCHEEFEDDESLPKLFELLDDIQEAERYYVRTASRLERVSEGVLLVEAQQFKFQDAMTHLIELAPLQHTLDNELVDEKVQELNEVCDEVNRELDAAQQALEVRHKALVPIWAFAVLFSIALYVKFKRLKHRYVKPLPEGVSKWG